MIKSYYPIALKLKNKYALVIGGGQVAERKIRKLVRSEVFIKVISPNLTSTLKRLVKSGRIRWINRSVIVSDIKGADIIIAATSNAAINKNISRWAKKESILVNVVDQPELSDFISPAVFKKSKATVAIYTDGRDPLLSRDLKNFLKEQWHEFLSYKRRL